MLLALDADGSAVHDLVVEAAERFKLQRMCSPPDTAGLLMSIIGPIDLAAFAEAWRRNTARDEVARFFLSQMQVATAVHGTARGEILGEESLLPIPTPS